MVLFCFRTFNHFNHTIYCIFLSNQPIPTFFEPTKLKFRTLNQFLPSRYGAGQNITQNTSNCASRYCDKSSTRPIQMISVFSSLEINACWYNWIYLWHLMFRWNKNPLLPEWSYLSHNTSTYVNLYQCIYYFYWNILKKSDWFF